MTITADELLITEALHKRHARQRDLAREIAAINDLARAMVRRPDALQRRFVELALDLCRAGSDGWQQIARGFCLTRMKGKGPNGYSRTSLSVNRPLKPGSKRWLEVFDRP